jgi:tRNA(Ile)-lysidine synthase
MRAAGATTPDPQEWAPSPVWPQGRGLFLLRPLLGAGRVELRDWLAARSETWVEDPANADPRYARSRARLTDTPAPGYAPAAPLTLAAAACEHAGIITLARDRLRAAAPQDARRFVALAAVCAGGRARRPATAHIARATDGLRGADAVIATLAGARLEADADEVRIFREAGEARRSGMTWTSGVWDGRFDLCGPEVRPLAGLARRLPPDQQRALKEIPATARGALPVCIGPDGAVTCSALTGAATSLVGPRLRAAAGLVEREPA